VTECYQWRDTTLILHCYLQPNAATDEIAGLHDGLLKIRIAVPPVEGKANQRLIRFISHEFGVANSAVTITAGLTSRRKTLAITNPPKLPAGGLLQPTAAKR